MKTPKIILIYMRGVLREAPGTKSDFRQEKHLNEVGLSCRSYSCPLRKSDIVMTKTAAMSDFEALLSFFGLFQ